ncbi:hypothetical protein TWF217_005987 [Orbilia oligospora]|nr:hypothetical protein TWF751_006677 [Orbilia oligospora]KAF3257884.1 hypothetical protein TWF217_005987 [Orbilia oligospora]KAF3281461.1 hypothetical protein TWF132_011229 [Orbilia oligospora]
MSSDSGKVEFGARFGTSWWWLKKASVYFSAKDSKLVTDIQAKVEIEGEAAFVTAVGVSAKILGSGLNSDIELLLPKFQYEIEAGYPKAQFCDGFEGMTEDNKAALDNNLVN